MRFLSVKETVRSRSTQVNTCTILVRSLLFYHLEHQISFAEHDMHVAYIGATSLEIFFTLINFELFTK